MVITELKEKLDSEFQKYYNTILINGDWGIGKTYYINEYLQDKKPIYVSLFGINNIEEVKCAIYYELSKNGAKVDKILKKIEGKDVGISILALPIPSIRLDIEKRIKKLLQDKNMILVIDDLERKSDEINTEELLGFIEKLSEIRNLKILLIACENQIRDKDNYNRFKEKVINKTYNITQYSDEAVSTICNQLISDNSIQSIISDSKFYSTIINILSDHKINNLRTLQKAIMFSKIILTNLDNDVIKDVDKTELIRISFAIVIEYCDKLYSKTDSNESIENCVLKNYFDNTYENGMLGKIISINNIYNDEDTAINYERILNYYIAKYNVTISEKDIFYCDEQEVEQRLNNFINNSIKKTNNKLDINSWFEALNNYYPWAEKINKNCLFVENEIISAMDKYIKTINVNDNLYNIIDRTMPLQISHPDMERYYGILKEKTAIYYYKQLIENIKESMNENEYNVDLIKNLFDSLTSFVVGNDVIIKEVLQMLERNCFFVPDINGDISEEQWHWCHTIWDRIRTMADSSFRKKLYDNSQKLIKKYTNIGKYRINSLNNQYNICKD